MNNVKSKVTAITQVFLFAFPGGFCQSSPLCWSRGGLPFQYAFRLSPVGFDLQTGQDPGAVLGGTPADGDGAACPQCPGAQYPTNMTQTLVVRIGVLNIGYLLKLMDVHSAALPPAGQSSFTSSDLVLINILIYSL